MGFDMNITINLLIDPDTGLPAVRSRNGDLHPFVLDEFAVPVHYRKWLHQKGSHLHNYIMGFDGEYNSDAWYFLHVFPDWDDISQNFDAHIDNWVDGWTENEHDEFRKALEWFASKDVFTVSWSY